VIEFRPILPDEIPQRWEWLRVGVAEMMTRWPPHCLIEDFYGDFRRGAVGVLVLVIDGEEKGWVAVKTERDGDGPVLHITAFWSRKVREHWTAIWDALDVFAKNLKAKRIRWESARDHEIVGWGKEVRRTYERELT
jgi:hypothetical protein